MTLSTEDALLGKYRKFQNVLVGSLDAMNLGSEKQEKWRQ
jgi:hypothetical protein